MGTARVAVPSTAGTRVAGAVGATVVASVGPQRLADDEPMDLEGGHSPSYVASAVLDALDVAGLGV